MSVKVQKRFSEDEGVESVKEDKMLEDAIREKPILAKHNSHD